MVEDRGTWSLFNGTEGSVGIISSDFKHDVVLYVNGDFESSEQRIEYAKHILERLNLTIPK